MSRLSHRSQSGRTGQEMRTPTTLTTRRPRGRREGETCIPTASITPTSERRCGQRDRIPSTQNYRLSLNTTANCYHHHRHYNEEYDDEDHCFCNGNCCCHHGINDDYYDSSCYDFDDDYDDLRRRPLALLLPPLLARRRLRRQQRLRQSSLQATILYLRHDTYYCLV